VRLRAWSHRSRELKYFPATLQKAIEMDNVIGGALKLKKPIGGIKK